MSLSLLVSGVCSTPAWARNEVQTIALNNVTAASVAISHPSYSGTATFAPGASAAEVQAALEAKFGTSTVNVSGGSTLGADVTVNANLTGSIYAGSISSLVDDNTNNSTEWRGENNYVTFQFSAPQPLSKARAFVVAQEMMNHPMRLSIYGSNTGSFTGEQVNIGLIYVGFYATNTWVETWEPDLVPAPGYVYYRIVREGIEIEKPTFIGEIELIAGSGYSGTYTVQFTGSKGDLNLAQMSSGTSGVNINTTVQGAREWMPGTAITGGTIGAAETTVIAGETLAVGVTGAQDMDDYHEGGATSQEADTLSYTWRFYGSRQGFLGKFC